MSLDRSQDDAQCRNKMKNGASDSALMLPMCALQMFVLLYYYYYNENQRNNRLFFSPVKMAVKWLLIGELSVI